MTNIANKNTDYKLATLPFASSKTSWDQILNQLQLAFLSKKIYLFGEGFCEFIVHYTHRKLLLKKVYSINLNGVEISTISNGEPHTLITFSHSGENKRGLEKIAKCKQYGGTVLAITASTSSSYSKESDYCIIVENFANETDYENINLNFFFGNTINLIEYLIDNCI